jgi:hypothetical protein
MHSWSRAIKTVTASKKMFELEKQVALAAVLKACHVARKVQKDLVESETAVKDDKSPVTGTR